MQNTKVAINAANLHAGGAVQVATSFIHELSSIDTHNLELDIFASSEVDRNLESIGSSIRNSPTYFVHDTRGAFAFFSALNTRLSNYALTFTIFGPNYLALQRGTQIVGFAQPWIIYDDAYTLLGTKDAIKARLKFLVQSVLFRRADRFVVELEHVKDRLVKRGISRPDRIDVVHNCLSSIYLDQEKWRTLDNPISRTNFSVGFLGRDYAHKNTSILPEVRRILSIKHNISVDIFVTLNDAEWADKSAEFRRTITNVGPLTVAQCPSYYQAMDAVVFPSILECFSATPLEAMALEKPIFASDRSFVRDVCAEFAYYFDPLDPESAADAIADYIQHSHGRNQARLRAAREHAMRFSSARRRAERYIEIIRSALAKSAP